MSNGIRFRLTRADGSQVQPLWLVLAVIAENGFRVIGGSILDTARNGSFALGTLVYEGADAERVGAMPRICEELGEECTNTELVPA